MTEANEQEQKRPLTLRSGGTLGLRRPVETGQVRQSFSHGRSKQVTVEVRKKRVVTPGAAPEPSRPESPPTVARAQPAAPDAPEPSEPARRLGGTPRTLTAEEHATRVRVLQDARKADVESRRREALLEEDRRRLAGALGDFAAGFFLAAARLFFLGSLARLLLGALLGLFLFGAPANFLLGLALRLFDALFLLLTPAVLLQQGVAAAGFLVGLSRILQRANPRRGFFGGQGAGGSP